jgi:hypothetical protein
MSASVVDEFYDKYNQLLGKLSSSEEPSLGIWANDTFSRLLVIVSANYFEREVMRILLGLVKNTSKSTLVVSFLEMSTKRRYHEYFAWEKNNANKFFSMFGEDFKNNVSAEVAEKDSLNRGVQAFLEIGRTRNELVHQELLSIPLTKTAEEFYALYKDAISFIEFLQRKLV